MDINHSYKTKQHLPRATKALAEKYEALHAEFDALKQDSKIEGGYEAYQKEYAEYELLKSDPSDSGRARLRQNKIYKSLRQDEIHKELHKLNVSYNWAHIVFTDATTGKKGLMDVAGNILVPAEYDGFDEIGRYRYTRRRIYYPDSTIAWKDGLYGVVDAFKKGKVVIDFRYTHLSSYQDYSTLYIAHWGSEKERFGILNYCGKVLCPNILTKIHKPFGFFVNMAVIENGNKVGCVILNFPEHVVLPEYDGLDIDNNDLILFRKDGVEGYVVTKTGEFVPKERYNHEDDHDEKYYAKAPIIDD